MKYPHVQQHDEKDCGAACLAMVAEHYGLKLPIARCRELIKVDNMGANMYGLETGAAEIGFEAECLEGSFEELSDGISDGDIKYPFIARIINEHGYEHYIVVWDIDMQGNVVYVGDPGHHRSDTLALDVFKHQWQGQIVSFVSAEHVEQADYKKGSFLKFFKYVLNQKKLLAFVMGMSIVISMVNIAGSMVFQYVTQEIQATAISRIMSVDDASDGVESEPPPLAVDKPVRIDESADIIDAGDSGQTNQEQYDAAMSLISGRIGDYISKLFPSLAAVCFAVILMYVMKSLLEIWRSKVLAQTMKLIDIPLTMGYYNHLLDLPASFYGTRNTGEFMSRFSDAGEIKSAVSSAAMSVVLDSLMAIVCGIFLFWLNPLMFGIVCLILAVYAIILFAFIRPLKDINHKSMEQGSQVVSYLKETIDGIETIKSYNYMSSAKKKTNSLYEKLLDLSIKGSVLGSVQNALVTVSTSIGTVALLWAGALLCMSGKLTLSELFIFYYMLGYFTSPMQSLIGLQPAMQTATVAAERLNDVLDTAVEDNNKPKAESLTGDIVLDSVDFRYGNRDLVLENLSLVFKSGKRTALVGESGCGKTTISKLLMAFFEPEAGAVTIGGVDIKNYSPMSVRDRIAYISQKTFLFADTIYENLRMGRSDITDEEIEQVCKDCLADEFIMQLPLGYNTKIEEDGANLSGGQRQRLAIARALLRKPDILIMDEATSNLDTISERAIQKLIDELSESITVIIIAHRLKTVQNCDMIYVMKKGQVIEQGTHTELLAYDGVYAANWK